MKAYTKVATPERIPTNLSISQLADRLNKILPDLARQINNAITSLTGGLMDAALWAQGEIITLTQPATRGAYNPSATDLIVPHKLGRIPRYWILLDSTMGVWKQGASYYSQGIIWRSPTPWTDKAVFFRVDENAWVGQSTFKILLLP